MAAAYSSRRAAVALRACGASVAGVARASSDTMRIGEWPQPGQMVGWAATTPAAATATTTVASDPKLEEAKNNNNINKSDFVSLFASRREALALFIWPGANVKCANVVLLRAWSESWWRRRRRWRRRMKEASRSVSLCLLEGASRPMRALSVGTHKSWEPRGLAMCATRTVRVCVPVRRQRRSCARTTVAAAAKQGKASRRRRLPLHSRKCLPPLGGSCRCALPSPLPAVSALLLLDWPSWFVRVSVPASWSCVFVCVCVRRPPSWRRPASCPARLPSPSEPVRPNWRTASRAAGRCAPSRAVLADRGARAVRIGRLFGSPCWKRVRCISCTLVASAAKRTSPEQEKEKESPSRRLPSVRNQTKPATSNRAARPMSDSNNRLFCMHNCNPNRAYLDHTAPIKNCHNH